jgi:hypothetical protein
MGDKLAPHQMPLVDMKKEFEKLNASDQHFIKKLEKLNLTRAKDTKMLRSRNKLTGILIGAAVIGIYAYTILSVKQEKFLDDFDKTSVKKDAS